jgi:hypothetical protein
MTSDSPVHAEDVIPVHSRISWSAIVAGSMLALAVSLLLTLLGSAVGLSVHDSVNGRGLAVGAVVWAVVVTAGSLFLGGFIASQLTTGENKIEGALYGLLVWAVVFGTLMFLAARATQAGFTAMIGMANANNAAPANGVTWEDMARQAGASPEEIDRVRKTIPERTGLAGPAVNEDNATRAAWYTFLGTLVSMLAAAVGGFVGSGPTLRLFNMRVQQPGAMEQRGTFVRT